MGFNSLMIWLIRSPFHRLLDKSFMVLTYTGRKSGKTYQVPVNYTRQGDTLATFSLRERTWWRNLRGGAPVVVRLGGKDISATSQAIQSQAEVAEALSAYLHQAPRMAKYFQVGMDSTGLPDKDDIRRSAAGRVVIQTRLDAA